MPTSPKTQTVRLGDVFLLAPFMVYAASKIQKGHEVTRWVLIAAGVGTALYNAKNYLQVSRGP